MTYCFSTADRSSTVERCYPANKVPRRIRIGGRYYYHDICAEQRKAAHAPGNWPMKSYAAGVSPSQIPEAMAADRRNGVPIDYDPKTGDAIFSSRRQRARWAEAYKMYDLNGGYSDPQKR